MDNTAMEFYQKVGQRIKEIRLQKKMSQADLSVAAKISLPHISDIERGKTKLQLATFTRLAEALQVSSDALLRPDIPQVNSLYQGEFDELLKDCRPDEIDAIFRIVKELKHSLKAKRDMYE